MLRNTGEDHRLPGTGYREKNMEGLTIFRLIDMQGLATSDR
jgi:hypothetical protein